MGGWQAIGGLIPLSIVFTTLCTCCPQYRFSTCRSQVKQHMLGQEHLRAGMQARISKTGNCSLGSALNPHDHNITTLAIRPTATTAH